MASIAARRSFRGGGRNLTPEEKLLQGMQKLLQDVIKPDARKPDARKVKPNPKGGGKGKGKAVSKSDPPTSQPEQSDTYGLVQAVQTLITRASRKPEGLLERLKKLVHVAEQGQLRRPKKKQRKASGNSDELDRQWNAEPPKRSNAVSKPMTRWTRACKWKARAQDWGVRSVLRGGEALCNALDKNVEGNLLCQVVTMDEWSEVLQISHAAGRKNITIVMEAMIGQEIEIPGDLKFHGWIVQKVFSAGYVEERLVQRPVWVAKCSPAAPGLVAGSVLKHQRPVKPNMPVDSFVFRISCDLRFISPQTRTQLTHAPGKFFRLWLSETVSSSKDLLLHLGDTWKFQKIEAENLIRGFVRISGRERAMQMLKASGQEHKGQLWFLDPVRWEALVETPPRLLWCDKQGDENQLAFANRIAKDAGPYGVARGRVQLALRVKPDDVRLTPVSSVWRAEIVPFGWDYENVTEVLQGSGFTDIDILSKQRRRGGSCWLFRASRSDQRDQLQIHFDEDADEPELDLFLVKQAKRRPVGQVKPLKPESDVPFSTTALAMKGAGKGKGQGKGKNKFDLYRNSWPTLHSNTGLEAENNSVPRRAVVLDDAPADSLFGMADVTFSGDEDEDMDNDERTQGQKRKGPVTASPAKVAPNHRRTKIPENLRRVPNPGSGNCLFHCFAQAETTSSKIRSHRQLRAFIVNHMTKHWNKFNDFWDGLSPENLPMDGDFSDYLKKISLDKSWGGYCEVAAYAAAVSRPVLVVHAQDEIVHVFNANDSNAAVVLYYKHEHYELVLPSDDQLQAIWQNAEEAGLGLCSQKHFAKAYEGYAITLDLESSIVTSVWRRPSKLDGPQFLEYAASVTEEAQRRQIPVLWVGDWNETPADNALSLFLNGNALAVTEHDGEVPSRFGGKRCLDYGLINGDGLAHGPCYSEAKISDHKMFWLKVRLPIFETDSWRFAWKPTYECPPEIPVQQWRDLLAEQWTSYTPCFSSDPDHDWKHFHACAEKFTRATLHACGQPVSRLGHGRGKLPRVVKAERPQVHKFGARKLINVLGRIYEVKRQLHSSQVDKQLLEKLRKNWPPKYEGSWTQAIEAIEHDIAAYNKQAQNLRMSEWRARMRRQGKEVTRWMKPQALPNPMLLADDSRATITQTLDGIRSYWQQIWNRENVVPHVPSELGAVEAAVGPQADWLPDASRKAVHPSPEIVQNSMPQGDAFAPLALLLLLKGPIQDVSRMTGVRQVTYVDDRALSSREVPQLVAGIDRPSAWALRLLQKTEDRKKKEEEGARRRMSAHMERRFTRKMSKAPTDAEERMPPQSDMSLISDLATAVTSQRKRQPRASVFKGQGASMRRYSRPDEEERLQDILDHAVSIIKMNIPEKDSIILCFLKHSETTPGYLSSKALLRGFAEMEIRPKTFREKQTMKEVQELVIKKYRKEDKNFEVDGIKNPLKHKKGGWLFEEFLAMTATYKEIAREEQMEVDQALADQNSCELAIIREFRKVYNESRTQEQMIVKDVLAILAKVGIRNPSDKELALLLNLQLGANMGISESTNSILPEEINDWGRNSAASDGSPSLTSFLQCSRSRACWRKFRVIRKRSPERARQLRRAMKTVATTKDVDPILRELGHDPGETSCCLGILLYFLGCV
eukprot:s24_g4.t1